MAWTAPRTWVTAENVTAALLNTHLRDNLLETTPAKVTSANDLVYASGANALTRLASVVNRVLVTDGSGVPAWESFLDGTFFDGDKLDIDWNPSNYTPDASPSEADDVDDLTAHLKGIDTGLNVVSQTVTGTYTGDGTTSQGITGLGFSPKFVQIIKRRTTGAFDPDGRAYVITTDVMVDDNAAGMALVPFDGTGSAIEWVTDAIISLDADGFTVDDNGADEHPNQNTQVYNYLAIG